MPSIIIHRICAKTGEKCQYTSICEDYMMTGGCMYLREEMRWACQRPLTHRWGSGQVFDRIIKMFGKPDVVFGKTDGNFYDVVTIDKDVHNNPTYVMDWANMPFAENQWDFGYWDSPYDKMYKREGMNIWRTCKKLAILHTHIYPISWLKNAKRIGMVAITMGPLKQIRCLQVFEKEGVVVKK